MISVVIPAFNEEAVIARCLRTLTAGAAPGELEIIVACNGCNDRTAAIAREFGRPVRVVETDEASKIAALNLGDAAATSFPRCFVDADVDVTFDTLREVAARLESGAALAAAPAMHVDLSHASWPVRAFYAIWLRQPFHQRGIIGGGFYGLSRAGRARFESFPHVIADDEFVRTLFDPSERATTHGSTFTIRAPRTWRDLIRIKTRSRLGRLELKTLYPDRFARREHVAASERLNWWKQPRLWPAAAVYGITVFITRLRASRQASSLQHYRWERDESSRQPRPTGAT